MKVLIASANGYGNAGDDMCALMAQHYVREAHPRARVKVTAPPFDDDAAAWADAFVLGGGGIVYDANPDNMENYLEYMDYGQERGKITVGIGLGEQGIVTKKGAKRYADSFNKAELITVRSTLDSKRLKDCGVKEPQATQDLAFGFDYAPYAKRYAKKQARRAKARLKQKPKLGVVLSNQEHLVNDLKLAFSKEEKKNALQFKNSFEKALPKLMETYDVTVITQSRDDLDMAASMVRHYGVKVHSYRDHKDMHKLLKVYADQDIVLTQRFHGAIFSLMMGIPVVILGYHSQKQYKLLKDMKLEKRLLMYHEPKKLDKLMADMTKSSPHLEDYAIKLTDEERSFIDTTAAQNKKLLTQALK